jgi:hypothetical protein
MKKGTKFYAVLDSHDDFTIVSETMEDAIKTAEFELKEVMHIVTLTVTDEAVYEYVLTKVGGNK